MGRKHPPPVRNLIQSFCIKLVQSANEMTQHAYTFSLHKIILECLFFSKFKTSISGNGNGTIVLFALCITFIVVWICCPFREFQMRVKSNELWKWHLVLGSLERCSTEWALMISVTEFVKRREKKNTHTHQPTNQPTIT